MNLYLGIDTSCYTTSVAVMDEEFRLVGQSRQILKVKQGDRGLRQSEALFQHVQNLPVLFKELGENIDFSQVKMISVSAKPRPVTDSYMPVFSAGVSYTTVISQVLKVPVRTFSHQEGHMMAGIWSAEAEFLMEKEFLAFHISGGTTELLRVNRNESGFDIEIIGGTKDLHAGQFIDRIGVAMGLSFPAGPTLEKLASEASSVEKVPVSIEGLFMNLSGPESHVQRRLRQGADHSASALGVIKCISDSVAGVIKNGVQKTGIKNILMVGGVCANRIMNKELIQTLNPLAQLYFAMPEYSTDNAVGIALLGAKGFIGNEE